MASHIDYEKCIRCRTCYEHCPEGLYGIAEDGSIFVAHPEECWLCGACEMDCPTGALKVIYDTDSKLLFL